jgi:hypothetical protein
VGGCESGLVAGEEHVCESVATSGHLTLTEPVERDRLSASGEAVGVAAHGDVVCAAREQEAAGPAVLVDGGLDGEQESWGSLDLADRHEADRIPADEGVGVAKSGLAFDGDVEVHEPRVAVGEDLTGESARADLTSADSLSSTRRFADVRHVMMSRHHESEQHDANLPRCARPSLLMTTSPARCADGRRPPGARSARSSTRRCGPVFIPRGDPGPSWR